MNKYYKMFSMALVSLTLACSSPVSAPQPVQGTDTVVVVEDVDAGASEVTLGLPSDVTPAGVKAVKPLPDVSFTLVDVKSTPDAGAKKPVVKKDVKGAVGIDISGIPGVPDTSNWKK